MMVKYNFRYLLLIVIHRSTDPYLVKMKQTQQELYDSMGIDYYYLYRDPDIREPEQQGRDLIFPGEENIIPGLLIKTIDALLYVERRLDDYDYVIRSNSSTLIDFRSLDQFILHTKPNYTGHWQDATWKGKKGIIPYVKGIACCMSRQFVQRLLYLRHRLDYTVVEDCSIGEFWIDYVCPHEDQGIPDEEIFWLEDRQNLEQTLASIEERRRQGPITVYRCRTRQRDRDAEIQQQIALDLGNEISCTDNSSQA